MKIVGEVTYIVVVDVERSVEVDDLVSSKDCRFDSTSSLVEAVLVPAESDSMSTSFFVDEGKNGPSNRNTGFTAVASSVVLDANSGDAKTEITNVVSTINVPGTVNVVVFE